MIGKSREKKKAMRYYSQLTAKTALYAPFFIA
jgi:hypothetical protein